MHRRSHPEHEQASTRRRRAIAALVGALVVAGVVAPSLTGVATGEPQFLVAVDASGELATAQRLSVVEGDGDAVVPIDDGAPPVDDGEPSIGGGLQPPPPGMIAFPVDAADDCSVTDNFGDPRGASRRHEGLDIVGNEGRAVYAVSSGTLTQIYVDRGLDYGAGHGWKVYDEVNDVTYKFFHLASHEPGLTVGDTVEFGDVIGYVGDTGATPGANHLHFEYRPGNVARDPLPLIVRHPNCWFEN